MRIRRNFQKYRKLGKGSIGNGATFVICVLTRRDKYRNYKQVLSCSLNYSEFYICVQKQVQMMYISFPYSVVVCSLHKR